MRTAACGIGFALALLAAGGLAGKARAADEKPLKVLIIDGQNNHQWELMTPLMKAQLEKTGRFLVSTATSPPADAGAAEWDAFRPEFGAHDVVLSNYNGKLWPEEVRTALVKFVGNGGGLVIIHAANNAFPEWPEWNRMIGLGWRDANFGERVTLGDDGRVVRTPKGEGPGAGHGPIHEFVVETRDAEHPVMQGLPARWRHAADELYHGQRGPAQDMYVLATAFSDKDKGGTGAHEPMIWWIPFGQGRVFTTVMGHVNGDETRAIRCIGFLTVMNRGCEWAATGKVTLPVPDNFPTAEAVSLIPEE